MREIKLSDILGYAELRQYCAVEGSRVATYGYRIDYDRNGVETGRTKPFLVGWFWFA